MDNMKCIKTIRPTKSNETGVNKRVSDDEADTRVRGGSWVYVSKTEYKTYRKGTPEPVVAVISPEEDVPTVRKEKNKKNKK